jgi:hypothetical protein
VTDQAGQAGRQHLNAANNALDISVLRVDPHAEVDNRNHVLIGELI